MAYLKPLTHPKWPDGIDMRCGDRGVFRFETDGDGDGFMYDEITSVSPDELSMAVLDIANCADGVYRADAALAEKVAPEDLSYAVTWEPVYGDGHQKDHPPWVCRVTITHGPTGTQNAGEGETLLVATIKATERVLRRSSYLPAAWLENSGDSGDDQDNKHEDGDTERPFNSHTHSSTQPVTPPTEVPS